MPGQRCWLSSSLHNSLRVPVSTRVPCPNVHALRSDTRRPSPQDIVWKQLRCYSQISRHSDLISKAGDYSKSDGASGGSNVAIAGLVRSIRKQKKRAFAHISDGSTLAPIQALLSPEQAEPITNGTYVELHGNWKESPGQGQAYELHVTEVRNVGKTDADEYPIQKKLQTPDYLRSLPHLRFRTPFYSLLARTRGQLIASIHDFYTSGRSRGEAVQVHPPLITSSDCEGAGEVFTISPKSSIPPPNAGKDDKSQPLYFRDPKYLTVSGQLHLEAYSAELGDVWTLSPTFRAEESETPRHLSEFYMLEAEFRGMQSLDDLTNDVKELTQHIVSSLANHRVGHELKAYYSSPIYRSSDIPEPVDLEQRWSKVLETDWPRMIYAEAIEHLEAHHSSNPGAFRFPPSYSTGLQLEHERYLVEHIADNVPLFVTDYPQAIKPFYMLQNDDKTVACFDLLFPFGTAELVGGSLREHRLDHLVDAMRAKGLVRQSEAGFADNNRDLGPLQSNESVGTMDWYLDLRRYGSAPHGGFGMGFDRLLAYLTGIPSVKDTVGFPRWFGRADC